MSLIPLGNNLLFYPSLLSLVPFTAAVSCQTYTNPFLGLSCLSIIYSFAIVALEAIVSHTVYSFDQIALLANVHYIESPSGSRPLASVTPSILDPQEDST